MMVEYDDFYHGLSVCTGDNLLAKARELSPHEADKPLFNYY